MKEIMAVYDTEAGYADMLARKLMQENKFPFYVEGFSDMEGLMSFLRENPAAVVLTDQKDMKPELSALWEETDPETLSAEKTALVPYGTSAPGRVILLTELQGYDRIGAHGAVYKYQPVSRLSEEILKLLQQPEKPSGMLFASFTGVRFIGVAGPVGRCRKTSFCLALGQLLAGRERVLYLNFEPCAAFPFLFEDEFTDDLSELIYAFSNNPKESDLTRFLQNFHGLFFVPPVHLPEDLYRTPAELLVRLAKTVSETGGFGTVILDLGTEYRLIEAFLPMLNKLFIPTAKDRFSREKTRVFGEWIRRADPNTEKLDPEVITLPESRTFLAGKAYIEQLLWSETGDYVRDLLEREG